MSEETSSLVSFKVEDFLIFCGDKKFKVTLKTKKWTRTVIGKFTKKGQFVHLFVEVGTKRTSRPKYKSFGPKTLVIHFG